MGALALSNNDTVFLAWSVPRRLAGCLGFSLHRVNVATRVATPLPARVGFAGDSNPAWKARTTDVWPVQKFSWKDLDAPSGGTYFYRVLPLGGKPGSLAPLALAADEARDLTTNEVTVSARRGSVEVHFNRGLLSTQATARDLTKGGQRAPSSRALLQRIARPGDTVRRRLSGQMVDALTALLKRAQAEGGSCWCALYELADPQLVEALAVAPRLHVILTNANSGSKARTVYDGENAPARQRLAGTAEELIDRFMPDGHIGHNKFVLYLDAAGRPQAVLSGSTNWTSTGLCTQSNNAILIESKELAQRYFEYWKRLAEDARQAGARPRGRAQPNAKLQSPGLRGSNRPAVAPVGLDGGTVRPWFSPNTLQKSKPAKNAATPVDLKEVFAAMNAARQAILFLAFQPGRPSIVTEIQRLALAKPQLFIRGALTDPQAVGEFDRTVLFHRGAIDASVVGVEGVEKPFAFWHKELFKVGHAVIHDKVMVIDPLGDDCVVVTGSHNLGFRASYNNDENLLILRGQRPVAEAYATHVMDVYDHYRWRWSMRESAQAAKPGQARRRSAAAPAGRAKGKTWSGLERDDAWQDRYFETGHLARLERLFWVAQGRPLPDEEIKAVKTASKGRARRPAAKA